MYSKFYKSSRKIFFFVFYLFTVSLRARLITLQFIALSYYCILQGANKAVKAEKSLEKLKKYMAFDLRLEKLDFFQEWMNWMTATSINIHYWLLVIMHGSWMYIITLFPFIEQFKVHYLNKKKIVYLYVGFYQ